MDAGITELLNGNYLEAMRIFQKIVKANPNDVEALNNLGIALEKMGRHTDAVGIYDMALKIDPRRLDVMFNKAVSLSKTRDRKKALELYDEILEIDPRHKGALLNKGTLLGRLRRYDDAIYLFNRALQIYPDFIEALLSKATAEELKGDPRAAVETLRRVSKIQDYSALHHRIGKILRRMAMLNDAITEFDRAIEMDPQNKDALRAKAYTLTRLKRYHESINCYERLIELDIKDASAYNGIAWNYYKLKECEKGIDYAVKALAIDPIGPPYHDTHACLLACLERYEEAMKSFEEVRKMDPGESFLSKDVYEKVREIIENKKIEQKNN